MNELKAQIKRGLDQAVARATATAPHSVQGHIGGLVKQAYLAGISQACHFLAANDGHALASPTLMAQAVREVGEAEGFQYCTPADANAKAAASSTCSNELRRLGQAYPRTCAKCGLGPCKKGIQ